MTDDNSRNDEDDLPEIEEDHIKPIDFGDAPAPTFPDARELKNTPGDLSRSEDILMDQDMIREEEEFKRQKEEQRSREEALNNPRQAQQLQRHHSEIRYLDKGEVFDMMAKTPSLKRIQIGAGWDQRSIEEEMIDVDLSLFLLNREGMTRVDEDFIFYNQETGCDGAIQHEGDSRTGAGDGDDEVVFIDFSGLPFDILSIAFVFSIYDPEFAGHHFGKIKNAYIRFVNKDDGHEMCRYKFDDEDILEGSAVLAGTLIREGPKWVVEAGSEPSTDGGLAKFATKYGIIVRELQSTAADDLDRQGGSNSNIDEGDVSGKNDKNEQTFTGHSHGQPMEASEDQKTDKMPNQDESQPQDKPDDSNPLAEPTGK